MDAFDAIISKINEQVESINEAITSGLSLIHI